MNARHATNGGGLVWAVLMLLLAASARAQTTWYVDDDAPNDPGPGDPTISDPAENGSAQHPYDAIQEGINAALTAHDEVIVLPGVYTGPGNRNLTFNDNPITLRSPNWDPNDVTIDCQELGRGFLFDSDEDASYEVFGFTIINGVAGGLNGVGGGIRCGTWFNDGSPTISNCVIRDCTAAYGGGISCTNGSNPIIDNTTFAGNAATVMLGQGKGGGVYAVESSPQFLGCRFYDNTASGTGARGGGVYLEASASQFGYCKFANNSASGPGGGVHAYQADAHFDHCTFYGNSASSGGGVYAYQADPDFHDCTFYGNAAAAGSAVAAVSYAHPTLQRSILCMGTQGAAAYCYQSSSVTITCCCVWGNADGDGCVGGQIGSNNNFAEYPGFCDPRNPGYELTVRDTSPCVPANSPCGEEVGAWGVGCSGPLTHYVCPTDPADFRLIQMALAGAQSGDTVILCDATYTGDGNRDLDYGGKDIVVQSESGDPEACVIDCGGSASQPHRGFDFHSQETLAARLEGVKITGGYIAVEPGGGAILCRDGSSPTITNCVLADNYSVYEGGGLCCQESGPSLIDCVLAQNDTAGHGGGATWMGDASGAAILRCVFAQNTASGDLWSAGGGLSSFSDHLYFEQCTFDQNSATSHGGGVYLGGGPGTFQNCTFHANAAPNGSAIYGYAGAAAGLDRSMIVFSIQGPAVFGPATITYCDVFENAGGPGSVGGQIGSSGNIALHPRFCDRLNGDLTLRANSPCAPGNHPTDPDCGLIGAWPVGCDLCLEDIDADGDIDLADLAELLANYGILSGATNDDGDIDGDDDVDLSDLAALLAAYGTTCP